MRIFSLIRLSISSRFCPCCCAMDGAALLGRAREFKMCTLHFKLILVVF